MKKSDFTTVQKEFEVSFLNSILSKTNDRKHFLVCLMDSALMHLQTHDVQSCHFTNRMPNFSGFYNCKSSKCINCTANQVEIL